MSSTLRTTLVLLAALFSVAAPTNLAAGPQPAEPTAPDAKPPKFDTEVKTTYDDTLKVELLDTKLEFMTKYGVLQIAVSDIRRIEFATRLPTDVAEKIALLVTQLGHSDFKVREAATEALKRYKEVAYLQVSDAMKSNDAEIARRAEEIIKYLQETVPAARLIIRKNDVIYTGDSQLTGRLTAEYLLVNTSMFGQQQLKLRDIQSLRTGAEMAAPQATIVQIR